MDVAYYTSQNVGYPGLPHWEKRFYLHHKNKIPLAKADLGFSTRNNEP